MVTEFFTEPDKEAEALRRSSGEKVPVAKDIYLPSVDSAAQTVPAPEPQPAPSE